MVVEDAAAEIEPSAAYALARNCPPVHLFNNAADLITHGAVHAFCHMHQKRCGFLSGSPDLFISGFSCKANSLQNAQRWTTNPVEHEHFHSFLDCKAFIEKHRPLYVVLENVTGVLLPCGSGEKKSVMDEIGHHLRGLDGYAWHSTTLDSAPRQTH